MRFAPLLGGLVVALSVTTPAAAQLSVREVWPEGRLAKRDPTLFMTVMLDRHNAARAALGQPPLAWDAGLAEEARRYAARLARERRFAHSDPRDRARREGENLWMGTNRAYAYADMVDQWVDERRDFHRGAFPDVARAGKVWRDVGHYTQIVWRDTLAVGCGMASNGDDEYLVCRYTPPGNIFGQDGLATFGQMRPAK